MNWGDFWAALALVMIIEGIVPFLSPAGYRNMVQQMAAMSAGSIRYVGLGLMVAGMILLLLLRG